MYTAVYFGAEIGGHPAGPLIGRNSRQNGPDRPIALPGCLPSRRLPPAKSSQSLPNNPMHGTSFIVCFYALTNYTSGSLIIVYAQHAHRLLRHNSFRKRNSNGHRPYFRFGGRGGKWFHGSMENLEQILCCRRSFREHNYQPVFTQAERVRWRPRRVVCMESRSGASVTPILTQIFTDYQLYATVSRFFDGVAIQRTCREAQ